MKKCKICGAEFDETLRENESDLCFSCYFWNEQYELDKNYRNKPENQSVVIIVDGHHYVADTDPSHKKNVYKGFCGTSHFVKFNNGEIAAYDNLWHQGKIPENFMDKLPNNAKFISLDEYQNYLVENKKPMIIK